MPRPAKQPPADLSGPPPAAFDGFTRETFQFLRGLKKNNNKPWFEAHRTDYEQYLREPSKALAETMGAYFREQGLPVTGNAKTSLFRINRDIRFSADKSPYKTHIGLSFPLTGSKKEEWCGFYVGFEPAAKGMSVFAGGGVYMPMPPHLKRIREKIAKDYKALQSILNERSFKKHYPKGLTGDSLTRMPKGYDEDHPAAPWLKMKSFLFGFDLEEKDLMSEKLPKILGKHFEIAMPLVEFLGRA